MDGSFTDGRRVAGAPLVELGWALRRLCSELLESQHCIWHLGCSRYPLKQQLYKLWQNLAWGSVICINEALIEAP